MVNGLSALRTPFVAALVLLVLVWTMLSLDMTSIRQASIVDPVPVYDATPGYNTDTGSEASRIASEAAALAAQATHIPGVGASSAKAADSSSPTAGAEKSGQKAVPSDKGPAKQGSKDRPLILYAYAEAPADTSRVNLEYFIRHGLHDAADFIFILNGETSAGEIIPNKKNIQVVQRPNTCYDLGAYAEVLLKNDLYKKYKRFITMNASIRGPFMPYWADICWSDMYLNKVTDDVKLVGMSANCWPTFHIQSMIWATDFAGISALLFPPKKALAYLAEHPIKFPPSGIHDAGTSSTSPGLSQAPGINGCFANWDAAVAAEVSSTSLIRAAGYQVDALMNAYQGIPSMKAAESCAENQDLLWQGKYFGTNLQLFETGFMKSNRDVDPVGLEKQTEWMKARNYTSYDYCSI